MVHLRGGAGAARNAPLAPPPKKNPGTGDHIFDLGLIPLLQMYMHTIPNTEKSISTP